MQLVDTHCHIHSAQLELTGDETARAVWLRANQLEPDRLVRRALDQGVTRLICVGTSADDSRLAVDFVQHRSHCWASIGLHPHEAKRGQAELEQLATLAGQPKIVAIGECGLDYFYSHSPKIDQERALRFQIELAQEYNLPLIFHIRNAFDDFWPIFDSYQGLRGVVHSFTDTHHNLDKLLERGLFVGINGIMTFTKHEWQLENTRTVPLNRLLLETDAPFLTPVPFRGRINEPAHVALVLDFLARLRNEPAKIIATSTTQNARQLFFT